MKHEIKCCIDYGFQDDEGTHISIPFYVIDGVLVQYTFGTALDDGAIRFENELGKVKQLAFISINEPLLAVNPIMSNRKGFIIDTIRKRFSELKKIQEHMSILFVFPKSEFNDTPFYEAFGINPNDAQVIGFNELGYTPREPFSVIDLGDMDGVTFN